MFKNEAKQDVWFVFIGILVIMAIALADSDFIGLVKSWM